MEICKIYRGDIFYIANIGETIGNEQEAGRPAVIVSNDKNNECAGTVEIVWLTTQEKPPLPTHVKINSAKKPSTVLCEQIYTISKERLGTYMSSVTNKELEEIDQALKISIGLDYDDIQKKELSIYKDLYNGLIERLIK